MESYKLAELKKLILLCKKNGVSSVSVGGVSLTFSPYQTQIRVKSKTKKETEIPVENIYSDDDFLNWSAPDIGGMNG